MERVYASPKIKKGLNSYVPKIYIIEGSNYP